MANEKRLIDANALLNHIDCCIDESKDLISSVCIAIKCYVEQMPTVDAVEVVRCKDCAYYLDEYCGERIGMVKKCETFQFYTQEDSFCSFGWRRKGIGDGNG